MHNIQKDGVERNTNERRVGSASRHKKLQTRINRIVGQAEGIQHMITEDRYRVDILNQISAVRSALDVELLTWHLEGCVLGHGTGTEHHCAKPMAKEELLAEVHTALSRFLK